MSWKIVADSSCDLFELESQSEIKFETVPFIMSIDGTDYVDDSNIDTKELVQAIDDCKESSKTACPGPGQWAETFDADNVFVVTISSSLSGSYNSALAAKEMVLDDAPDKKIEILDSLSTGPEMVLIIRKLVELIESGLSFQEVNDKIRKYMKTTHIIFALSSYNNLIRNGRIPKIAGMVAGKFKLTGIGIGSPQGTIDIKKIVRGSKKIVDTIVSDIKTRGENCKDVVISHCESIELAESIKQAINSALQNINVTIIPTRGLCSYYAEKQGIIVGF